MFVQNPPTFVMDNGKKYGLTWIAKELYIREKRSYCGLPIKSIKHLFHEEDEPGDKIYSKSI